MDQFVTTVVWGGDGDSLDWVAIYCIPVHWVYKLGWIPNLGKLKSRFPSNSEQYGAMPTSKAYPLQISQDQCAHEKVAVEGQRLDWSPYFLVFNRLMERKEYQWPWLGCTKHLFICQRIPGTCFVWFFETGDAILSNLVLTHMEYLPVIVWRP